MNKKETQPFTTDTEFLLSQAKKKGFNQGVLYTVIVFLLLIPAVYFVSSLGEQKRYLITEPDIELPTTNLEVEDSGDVDDGNILITD